jgi:hypothetical protein
MGHQDTFVRATGSRAVTIVGDNYGTVATGDLLVPDRVITAAQLLATTSSAKWNVESLAWGVETASMADVDWTWARFGPQARYVFEKKFLGGGPGPLPGISAPVAPAYPASGGLADLFSVYARLPHGRLAIIGEAGSGKSSAMILMMLAAFAHRQGLDDATLRDRCPVPVWLSAGEWDATRQSLQAWATGTVARDHGSTLKRHGADVASELLLSGRLALFVDGLDEMSDRVRTAAVNRLDDELPGVRVTVSSRKEEFKAARGHQRHRIPLATVVLESVTPAAAAAYLEAGHSAASPLVPALRSLTSRMESEPRGPVAAALSRPLALSLVRTTYGESDDPSELCNRDRFKDATAVDNHLLDRLLNRTYPPDSPGRRGLQWLAENMAGDRNLRWWEIGTWVPLWRHRLALSVPVAMVVALAVAAVLQPLAAAIGVLLGGARAALLGKPAAMAGQVSYRWPTRKEAVLVLKFGLPQFVFCAAPAIFCVATPAVALPLPVAVLGSVLGGTFALAHALFVHVWLNPVSDDDGVSPRRSLAATRWAHLLHAVLYGGGLGVTNGWPAAAMGYLLGALVQPATAARSALAAGLSMGLAVGLAAGLAILLTPGLALAGLYLRATRQGRIRFTALLRDAHRARVLRQAGPVYQFRHATLQDRLAPSRRSDCS